MNISIICFSMTGLETGEKLQKALKTEGEQVTLAKKSRYLPDSVSISTSQWAGEQFRTGKDGVIFIGACGIAVRSIALLQTWMRRKDLPEVPVLPYHGCRFLIPEIQKNDFPAVWEKDAYNCST